MCELISLSMAFFLSFECSRWLWVLFCFFSGVSVCCLSCWWQKRRFMFQFLIEWRLISFKPVTGAAGQISVQTCWKSSNQFICYKACLYKRTSIYRASFTWCQKTLNASFLCYNLCVGESAEGWLKWGLKSNEKQKKAADFFVQLSDIYWKLHCLRLQLSAFFLTLKTTVCGKVWFYEMSGSRERRAELSFFWSSPLKSAAFSLF